MFAVGKTPAVAADAYRLDPVVVTAEKTEQNLQEVPISVTAITAGEIKDSGIKTIQDFSRRVPNLFTANWGMRGNSFVFVRGIGAVNNEPAVGFNVDGVSYMDSRVFDSDLYEIERIEVLRGPQGTLYGKNSLAGVINIITKKPDNEAHFGVEQTLGNYQHFGATAFVRAPIVNDHLFFGVSGSFEKRNGYSENSFLHKDVDHREDYSGRAQLRWTPTDKIDITATVDGEKLHDGVFPLQERHEAQADPHVVSFDYNGMDKREALGGSLRASVDLPWFNVTSITAFRGYDDTTKNDQDFTPFDIMRAREELEDRQFTQELRLSSLKGVAPFKWLAGAYVYHRKRDQLLDLFYGQDAVNWGLTPFTMQNRANADLTTKGAALFGQGTYTLFDKLDVTLGLRYEKEKNEMDYSSRTSTAGIPLPVMDFDHSGSRTDGMFLPKFQVDYRWTDNFMTYAGISRGYRSGSFNTSFMDPSDFSFSPEYSWNYEAGFKSSLFDNRLTINGAIFDIELRDQQVTQVLPNANTVIRNAGKSRNYGFELEASALLPKGFQLDAGYGYTKAEYLRYSDRGTGVDYRGNTPPLAPKYTYTIALQHTLPLVPSFKLLGKEDFLNWVNRFEVQGVGNFYWNDANTLKQAPYELLNLRSSLETDNFSAIFWVNNLTNRKFNSVAFQRDPTTDLAEIGTPRTVGVTLRMEF
jgi:iron complex outermembrane receptor protein